MHHVYYRNDTDQQTLNTKQTADTVENKLWDNVLKQLQLPADTFNTFLSDTAFQGVEDGVAVITTSRSYAKDWLENRMCNQIRKVLVGRAADERWPENRVCAV